MKDVFNDAQTVVYERNKSHLTTGTGVLEVDWAH